MYWDPFTEFEKMRRRFEKAFEELPSFKGFRQPLTDIKVKDSNVEVYLEMPGVDKKDIEINVTENELEVKSTSKKKTEVEKKGYYKLERTYSGFYRLLPLPVEVIPEKTTAEFENGVLKITLRRAKPEKKKKGVKVAIK